jgi:hypothetical protein
MLWPLAIRRIEAPLRGDIRHLPGIMLCRWARPPTRPCALARCSPAIALSLSLTPSWRRHCAAGARHHRQIGPAIRHVFYADHQRHSNSKAGSFPGIRLEVWSGLDGPSPVEVFLTLCRNPARTPCPRSLFPRTAPSPESVAGGVCAPRRGAWLSSPLNERCYTESKLL